MILSISLAAETLDVSIAWEIVICWEIMLYASYLIDRLDEKEYIAEDKN